MVGVSELARGARIAFELARAAPDVREAEVFVAANAHLLTRLCYTSHIPCNGVEEPKSTSAHGLGLQVVFEHPDGPRVGFGSEARDLGPEGARRALARRGGEKAIRTVSLLGPRARLEFWARRPT
jgi:PmbA protein